MKRSKLIHHIIFIWYLAINILFIEKYTMRVTDFHHVIAIVYMFVICGIIWFVKEKFLLYTHYSKWLIGLGVVYLCIAISIQYSIDPLTIKVDRWSAIHNFLSGMLNGTYPYGQQTHLGGYGSPFPVWQIFHLPFYLLGNVGLSIIFVTIIFVWTIHRCYSTKVALTSFILLCISPAYWYEIAVRSDLITNVMLSAIIVEWFRHKDFQLGNHIVIVAITTGLLLSTRFIAVIPLCVFYGYAFLQMNWQKQLQFICIIVGTFGLTMLPFVFWKDSTLLFFEYNPFVLQTRQGSLTVLLFFAIIAIGIVIRMKNNHMFRLGITGFLLTTLVVVAFVEEMLLYNLWGELFSSAFDITYLSVALPFYIQHLSINYSTTLLSNS